MIDALNKSVKDAAIELANYNKNETGGIVFVKDYYYNQFSISKSTKQSRVICSPSPKLKTLQQQLLVLGLRDIPTHFRATAYGKGCSIVANARRHAGRPWLFKTDVADFFGSVRLDRWKDVLFSAIPTLHSSNAENLLQVLTLRRGLAQGAPTSPHLSNVFMRDFDRVIAKESHRLGVSYTRYADDISISGDDRNHILQISELVFMMMSELGLHENKQKTRLYDPSKRKIVTGLDVTDTNIRPTRRFRKKTHALVRAYIKYDGLHRIYQSVRGRLAFWNGISPHDPELQQLQNAFFAKCLEIQLRKTPKFGAFGRVRGRQQP